MFDVTQLNMQREDVDGVPNITIDPADLYPVMITRIKAVLEDYRTLQTERGEAPWASEVAPEIVAPPHRGGDARANVLLANALALPDGAWDDALIDRDQFYAEIPYAMDRQALIAMNISADALAIIDRVKARGDALEVAYGWFLHALRIAVGGHSTTITRDLRFRL